MSYDTFRCISHKMVFLLAVIKFIRIKHFLLKFISRMVRLCEKNNNCTGWSGWVERWNSTTQQWVPVCDSRWSERNTEVIF